MHRKLVGLLRNRARFDRKSGYSLARMPFDIILAPEALEDLRSMNAHVRAKVRTALKAISYVWDIQKNLRGCLQSLTVKGYRELP